MLKKTRILCLMILLFPNCFILFSNVLARDYAVGVEAGDWVRYDFKTTGPGLETPALAWTKLEVLSVVERNVTLRLTSQGQNGTETNQTITFDLAASGPGGYLWIVPANLTVGDSISLNGGLRNMTIETTRMCAGANRTVIGTAFWEGPNMYSYYFDKQTGVAVDILKLSGGRTMDTVAEDTNIWNSAFSVSDVLFLMMIVAIIVVVTVVIVVFRRRQVYHHRKTLPGIRIQSVALGHDSTSDR
jgi:hypothetical protein